MEQTTIVGILLTLAGCTLAASTIQTATSTFETKHTINTTILIIPNGQSHTINCETDEHELVVFLKSSKFANPVGVNCPAPAGAGQTKRKGASSNSQESASVIDCRSSGSPKTKCSITAKDVSKSAGCSNRALVVVYTCAVTKRLMVNNMIDDFE